MASPTDILRSAFEQVSSDVNKPIITHPEHGLPCNATTGFLTPAFRNIATTLTPELNMVGRPAHIYKAFLQILTDVNELIL